MATAVRRRISDEEDCQEIPQKVLRTMKRPITTISSKGHISATILSSNFGPSKLNLYLYVAEESRFHWKQAKDMFILKADSEPKKGLILFHEKEMDLTELCWKQFEFDPEFTSSTSVKWNSNCPADMVCVFAFGKGYWKSRPTTIQQTLKDIVRGMDKSRIFVITDSDEDKQNAVRFCKESQMCHQKHVLQTLDKSLLYETMYEILEKQLSTFISDLKSRASTRLVQRFTCELDILLGKLQSRKKKRQSALTEQCIAKIKSGREYGIVGHMLCGDVLYIFEDARASKDAQKTEEIKKSIEEIFKGAVHYRSIRDSLSPHRALNCGGSFRNSRNGHGGTLGIFGELMRVEQGASKQKKIIVALSSGHVISADTPALVPTMGEIGVCIWPLDSSNNIHDVSVIKIDQTRINDLTFILNKQIIVGEISKENLRDRYVFKYGATTERTAGYIGVIDDFQMFGEEVMTILPSRSECPRDLFSDKGDSGAIVLTKFSKRLYGIGVVYGGGLKLPDCENIREETIAVFLKRALDRFTNATHQTIELDKI